MPKNKPELELFKSFTSSLPVLTSDIHLSERVRRLSKEGFWIVFGQAMSVLGSLMLVRVLTEYLEPIQYGQLALGLTVAALVNQVVMGGVTSGIGRFYSIASEKNDLFGYIHSSQRLIGYATIVVFAIGMVLMACLLWLGFSQWIGLAATALVFSVFSGYNSSLNSIQNAARQRAIVALHGSLDAWLKILLAVGVIFLIGSSSIAVMLSYALSALLVTISQLLFLRRLIHPQNSTAPDYKKWERQMWLYSWPMAVGGLFNWGYYASQRWALELFESTDAVGQFYALTQIAYTPISMAGTMFMSFLTPILFARVGDPGNHDRVKNTFKIVLTISFIGLGATLVLGVISYFLHDKVFGLFVSPTYRDISGYMPYVVLAAGLLQVSLALSSIIAVRNETASFLPLAVLGNGFIALLNFYATSVWGIRGLLSSMVCGAVIHLTWMIIIVLRNTRKPREGISWD